MFNITDSIEKIEKSRKESLLKPKQNIDDLLIDDVTLDKTGKAGLITVRNQDNTGSVYVVNENYAIQVEHLNGFKMAVESFKYDQKKDLATVKYNLLNGNSQKDEQTRTYLIDNKLETSLKESHF